MFSSFSSFTPRFQNFREKIISQLVAGFIFFFFVVWLFVLAFTVF